MKHIAALSLVFAAFSVPSFAQEPDARAYQIRVNADLAPTASTQLSYPYRAASRGLPGSCEVSFVIDAAGHAEGIEVQACTSSLFRASAREVVSGLRFAPGDAAKPAIKARIDWSMRPGE